MGKGMDRRFNSLVRSSLTGMLVFVSVIVGALVILPVMGSRAGSDEAGGSLRYAGPIVVINIDGTINPASEEYLVNALKYAEERDARLLVIKLNTPGGLLDSVQGMSQALLQSPVPSVVYVTPSGGGAISAGMFLSLAAHYSAMTPGTTIGAAHPVTGSGQNIEGDMRAKVENFAATYAKSLAEQHGKNVEWVDKAVRESVAFTAPEALDKGIVNFVVADFDGLLQQLEGKSVKVHGREIVLSSLATAERDDREMSVRQKVANFLCDPNIAILLGLGAMLGLSIELYHPGGLFPGIFGAICLVLSIIAAGVLPLNYGGVVLLLLGGVFGVAELFVPSFGLWGIAGLLCFVLGSVYAVDLEGVWSSEGFVVNKLLVGSVAALVGMVLVGVSFMAVRITRLRNMTGQEGLVGQEAVVERAFMPTVNGDYVGKVILEGESWNAQVDLRGRPGNGKTLDASELETHFVVGQTVMVYQVDGLTLLVDRSGRSVG